MLRNFVVLSLLAMAVAKVPSYLPVCGRRNPDFDGCVKSSIESLRGKLREGMPELDVPSAEPFPIEQVLIADENNFKAYARNVSLYGMTDFTINSLHADLNKQTIDADVIFDKLKLTAEYNVTTTILVPLSGKGYIDLIADSVKAKVSLIFQVVDHKGKKSVYFPSMSTKLTVKDFTSLFKPTDEQFDSPLAQGVNALFQNSRQELIELSVPNLEKAISTEVLNLANQICKHFTYDEVLPDRE